MSRLLQGQSTLTDRYQTTIPEAVREALHLEKRDKINYIVQDDGKVLMFRASEKDPVLTKFLAYLAKDIQDNPSHLRTMNPELVARARALIKNVEIDLDAALSDEDE